MSRTTFKSKRRRQHASASTLAKALAPEEIRAGDFMAVLHEIYELPSYMWCADAALLQRDELVRIRMTPTAEAAPLKVSAVCLPFVLVREPCGRQRTLDVRRQRFARLDKKFARAARQACRAQTRRDRRAKTSTSSGE
jgi:hypothetical protein